MPGENDQEQNDHPSFCSSFCHFGSKKDQHEHKETIYDKWKSYVNEDGYRINEICRQKNNGELISQPLGNDKIKTVWDLFQNGLACSSQGKCLGKRQGDSYVWKTYQEVEKTVNKLAKTFKKRKIPKGTNIGIYSMTRVEWIETSLGCQSRSLVIVPLYDTLGAESCKYIVNQAELKMIFVDTVANVKKILQIVDHDQEGGDEQSNKTIETVVVYDFETLSEEETNEAKRKGIELVSYDDFLKSDLSAGADDLFDLPGPDDLLVIMYTSGTTGDPKGVMAKHKSIVADVTALDVCIQIDGIGVDGRQFGRDDICLHYLPLAHSYGLIVSFTFLFRGGAIGFFGGNVLKLSEDAQLLKPTFMPL